MEQMEGQRYLVSFIKEVKDFKEMSEIDFFMEYCVGKFGSELEDIKKEYSNYLSLQKENEEDILNYEEWLEEVYHKENEDQIHDRVYEYRTSYLECVFYNSQDNDYQIYELTLTCGGPNIYLTLCSRWNNARYEFNWAGERLDKDLSYMYHDIYDYLELDIYY